MTPLIETNWELFDEKENVDFKQMNGWISEYKSLIKRLENKYGTINLEVLNEEETEYSDKELGFERVKGNLRKVFLKAQKKGGGRKKPNVLLWGDSHAFHYVGMLEEFAIARQSSFVHSCMAACPPMINVRVFFFCVFLCMIIMPVSFMMM